MPIHIWVHRERCGLKTHVDRDMRAHTHTHSVYKSACNFYLENILNFYVHLVCVCVSVCFCFLNFFSVFLNFANGAFLCHDVNEQLIAPITFSFLSPLTQAKNTLWIWTIGILNFFLAIVSLVTCYLSLSISLFLSFICSFVICFMLVAVFVLTFALALALYWINSVSVYLRKTNSSNSSAERQRNRESHSLIIIAQKQELNVLPAFLTSYG